MSLKPMNLETFLFGVATGIATVATVQYIVNLLKPAQEQKMITQQSTSSHSAQAKLAFEIAQPGSVLASLDTELVIKTSKLQKIVLHMISEFKKGLVSDNEALKMLPSFVVKRPTGNELGTILALDLGGTNFRVCRVGLEGSGKIRMANAKFTVSEELKTGSGQALFDFFADCVASFCKEQGINVINPPSPVSMGFTFSFPVNQTALNAGSLIKWTKGFCASGVEGNDVVQLLQDSFHRKNIHVNVTAVVNDTVGTLIAHAYSDPQTYISVILGTGTNAAYVENAANVKKWGDGKGEVVINTEWGNYGEPSILPISPWDAQLDRASSNPKKQIFEKMISGMYLGEVARLALMDLVKAGELFNGNGSAKLAKPYAFETAFMARAERDHSLSLSEVKQLLEDVMEVPQTTVEDRRIVKRVCELIGTRAARLSAAGVAALVTKINRLDGCTVAIDGSVFEHYPHFGNRMRDALYDLLGLTASNIILEQARDGSGQGAALIAALAQ